MGKKNTNLRAFVIASIIGLGWMVFSILHKPKRSPNVFYFKGTIKKVIASNNHAFCIYIIKLDTAFVRVVDSEVYKPNSGELPAFRYQGKWGELYITGGTEDVGLKIQSDTLNASAKMYNKNGKIADEAGLYPVTEDININFINTHSIFSTRTGSQGEK